MGERANDTIGIGCKNLKEEHKHSHQKPPITLPQIASEFFNAARKHLGLSHREKAKKK